MPVEIREIVIKTEIASSEHRTQEALTERDIEMMRRKLLEECKELIARGQKSIYKR